MKIWRSSPRSARADASNLSLVRGVAHRAWQGRCDGCITPYRAGTCEMLVLSKLGEISQSCNGLQVECNHISSRFGTDHQVPARRCLSSKAIPFNQKMHLWRRISLMNSHISSKQKKMQDIAREDKSGVAQALKYQEASQGPLARVRSFSCCFSAVLPMTKQQKSWVSLPRPYIAG